MKPILMQILAAVPGVPLVVNGVGFLVDPATAAESLGMPLLDGMGRSTQIGDFAAFFIASSILIFAGAARREWQWLGAGALILGLAALFRIAAFVLHGAPFAAMFIAVEIVITVWLMVFVVLFRREST